MNECLTTPQHKNKSTVGCQTNGILFIYLFNNIFNTFNSYISIEKNL